MTADPLKETFDRMRERTALATSIYAALKARKALSDHRAVAYRCPRRCLLLDVIQTPEGLILHRPGYKLSPALNESSSNAEGRAKNTRDGDRRWNENTGFVESWGNIPLNCDHVRVTLHLDDVHADMRDRHSTVVVDARGDRRAM